jgi:hypothetical protein
MVYQQKHIDPPMSLLDKKLRQGGRYAYNYFDMVGTSSTVFPDIYRTGDRNFCQFDNRLGSVHHSKNRHGHLALRRPCQPTCSRQLPSLLSGCFLEYGNALANTGTPADCHILPEWHYLSGLGRYLVSPQRPKDQWSRVLAGCGSFDSKQNGLCLGSESGGLDRANSTALGRGTAGPADVADWFPERRFRAVGDGFYASLAGRDFPRTTIISRLQCNAEIYDLPKKPRKIARGRPRQKGRRLPSPQTMARRIHQWQTIKVRERGRIRTRWVYARKVLWYRVLQTPILLVISRDPQGKEDDDFFFTTDVAMKPAEVIGCFADRWAIEDTFKYTKQFLGAQEPQTYKGQGPERAAALGLWLYSTVWLWYLNQKTAHRYFWVQPWYCQKAAPSFADAIRCLRRHLWRERIKYMFGNSAVHDKKFEFLLEALAPAA